MKEFLVDKVKNKDSIGIALLIKSQEFIKEDSRQINVYQKLSQSDLIMQSVNESPIVSVEQSNFLKSEDFASPENQFLRNSAPVPDIPKTLKK